MRVFWLRAFVRPRLPARASPCLSPAALAPLPLARPQSTGWGRGAGKGPWVMADLENGLFAGNDKVNPNNTPLTSDFVTAMVKGGENGFTLKGGDASRGALKVQYDGPRPAGYQVRWRARVGALRRR